MKDFKDIENLWMNASKPSLPDASKIISQIRTGRKKLILKNLLAGALLVLTFIFIYYILKNYDFSLVTTQIGIIVIFAALILGIIFSIFLMKIAAKEMSINEDAGKYLESLKEYKSRQKMIQTKILPVYFILLAIGLGLYMYEFAVRDFTTGVVAYSLTFGWLGFVWFYLKKKTIAKNEKQIDLQIEQANQLINQLRQE